MIMQNIELQRIANEVRKGHRNRSTFGESRTSGRIPVCGRFVYLLVF